VIDAVDRAIAERAAMDRGLTPAAVLSGMLHTLVIVGGLVVPLLLPKQPLLKAQSTAWVVPLPRGGGGTPSKAESAAAPAATPEVARAEPPEPAAPAPKVLKPPKEEPHRGLPDPNTKKGRPQPARPAAPAPSATSSASAGQASATPGVAFGAPPGLGVPNGVDFGGDWYLAGVQRRVWMIWMSQIRVPSANPALVTFTIRADGSVTDVTLSQSSGISSLDFAAQRAILSAAPFAPLPRHYETNRITIQAVFKPTS
jgi:TonB family protein